LHSYISYNQFYPTATNPADSGRVLPRAQFQQLFHIQQTSTSKGVFQQQGAPQNGDFNGFQYRFDGILVGGIPTPLKNDGVRQLG